MPWLPALVDSRKQLIDESLHPPPPRISSTRPEREGGMGIEPIEFVDATLALGGLVDAAVDTQPRQLLLRPNAHQHTQARSNVQLETLDD